MSSIEIKIDNTFTVKSLRNIQARLDKRKGQIGEKFQKSCLTLGNLILAQSLQYVPMDTRALYNSAHVRQEGSGFQTVTIVAYGSAEKNPKTGKPVYMYAGLVHQDLNAVHGTAYNIKYAYKIAKGKQHPRRPQEKAMFLEDVVLDGVNSGSYAVSFATWMKQ